MSKNILIINKLDNLANQERYQRIKKHLTSHGYKIKLINSARFDQPLKKLSFFLKSPIKFLILALEIVTLKLHLRTDYPLIQHMKLRANLIIKELPKSIDVVICQIEDSMLSILKFPNKIKIYDAPAPFADEIRYSGRYTKKTYKELEKIEERVIKSCDIFSSHWPTYTKYLQSKYKLANVIQIKWGCEKQALSAKPTNKNRIIFIGSLKGYWVNIPLLNKLCQQSVFPIDVYGGYRSKMGELNKKYYLGYLKNLDRLTEYQFGLITISKDPLRKIGFSAKHLLYISYGLPVLCPEWRQDKILAPATIPYNEKNFNQVLKKYSQKSLWLKKHKAALRLAKQLRWEKTLKPLVDKIDDLLGKEHK